MLRTWCPSKTTNSLCLLKDDDDDDDITGAPIMARRTTESNVDFGKIMIEKGFERIQTMAVKKEVEDRMLLSLSNRTMNKGRILEDVWGCWGCCHPTFAG